MEFSFDTNEGKTLAMNDDETKLLDEISFAAPEKKSVPLKPKPSRPSPFAKRAPGPVAPQMAPDEGLDMFMNPGKRTAPPPPMAEEFDGGEEGEEEDGFHGSCLVVETRRGHRTTNSATPSLLVHFMSARNGSSRR